MKQLLNKAFLQGKTAHFPVVLTALRNLGIFIQLFK